MNWPIKLLLADDHIIYRQGYGKLSDQKAATPGEKAWGQRALACFLCRAGETTRGIELAMVVYINGKAKSHRLGNI